MHILSLLLFPSLIHAIVLNPSWSNSGSDANGHYEPKIDIAINVRDEADKRSPEPQPDSGMLHIPLTHLTSRQHSPDLEVRQSWLRDQAAGMRRKYEKHLDERGLEMVRRDRADLERRTADGSAAKLAKRANSTIQLTDIGVDASYAGTVSVGTPAQNFLLILDTGSSDMWIAGSGCTSTSCLRTTTFQSTSSSLVQSSTPFDITYGSGDASGTLAQDTVTVGAFTVTGQTFAIVTNTSSNLISSPLSGLMGLAWQSIAQTGATPFWQALAASGKWTSAEMGFFMQRWRGVRGVSQVESNGGSFTMGGLDTTKYTGSVNYISIPAQNEDYWRIPVQSMSIQNQTISLSSPYAAIDTGTTLIGVPRALMTQIYGKINGSVAFSASSGYSGYWQYPCSTSVSASLQFGGLSYSISNADFNLGSFTRDTTMCTGAFFQMDLSSQSPIQWIVGASFLKNVYSTFRYSPPAIGFAALSGSASSVSNGTTTGGTTTSGGGTAGTGGTTSGAQAVLGPVGLWGVVLTAVALSLM